MATKKEIIKATLDKVTNSDIDVTVISDSKFCFSYIGKDENIFNKIKAFFKKELVYDYDEELDETFCYLNI